MFCPVSSVFLSFVPCLFGEKLTFAKTTYKPTEMKNLLLALSAAAILTSCGGRDAATMPIDLPADSIAHLDTLMAMSDFMSDATPSDYAIAWTHGGRRYLYDLSAGQATFHLSDGEDIYNQITRNDTAAYFLMYSPAETYGYQQIIDQTGRRLLSGPARYEGLPGGKVRVRMGLEQEDYDLARTQPGTWVLGLTCPEAVRPAVVTGSQTMDMDTVLGRPAGAQNTLYLSLHYEEPLGTTAADYAMGTWVLAQVAEPLALRDSMTYRPVIHTRDDYSRARGDLRRHFFAANDSVAAWSSTPVGVSVSMSLRWRQGDYYTYYRDTQNYTGGAHGYYTETYLTYDLAEGRPLTAGGLFRAEALGRVRALLLDSLAADRSRALGETITPADLDSQYGPVVFSETTPGSGEGITAVPALMPQGVVFAFQPYEMGSYAEGVVRVVLPYAAVRSSLRPEAARRLGL